jgi:hypothetical protein
MGRQPDHGVFSEDPSRGVGRQVVLPEVNAAGSGHKRYVRAVVNDQAHRGFARYSRRTAGIFHKAARRSGFFPELDQRGTPFGESTRLLGVCQARKRPVRYRIYPRKLEIQVSGFIIRKQSSPSL